MATTRGPRAYAVRCCLCKEYIPNDEESWGYVCTGRRYSSRLSTIDYMSKACLPCKKRHEEKEEIESW